jgi:ATP-binding protein involved in chromosome partitioning
MGAMLLPAALRQLAVNVRWGDLDYLVVDLPPGTADLQQELVQLLELSAVVIVVGPQDVAHLDARKVLAMFRDRGVPVLGGIENMTELSCPHCGEPIAVFPEVPHERSLWAEGVVKLGSIPLDPEIARAGDGGLPTMASDPEGPQGRAFQALAERIAAELERLRAA